MCRIENPTVHGDIHSITKNLDSCQGTAQIEYGIAVAILGREHGAGKYDGLAAYLLQVSGRPDHGVGTMGNDDPAVRGGNNSLFDALPVIVVHIKTVFLHE